MAKKINVEELSERSILEKILSIVEKKENTFLQSQTEQNVVYDNKSLKAKLGIKDKCLKKLRDNGYLGYSRSGDKYWYTQKDVDSFLRHFHYDAFATSDQLSNLGDYAK